jgi:hypothetical protein
MSTATSAPKGKPKKGRPAGLPDERFWIKYSQHHELPLSVTSSVFLHALAFGLIGLILAGILSGLFGGNKHQAPVKPFQLAGGGGGDPNGNTDGPSELALPAGNEATEKPKNADPIQPIETTNKPLTTPEAKTDPLVDPTEAVSRLMQEPTLSPKNLSAVSKAASDKLAAAIAKGQGGPGHGGGQGGGEGTGIGNKKGPGVGDGTITNERQLRWTMIFRTSSGHDYLKQLQDLNATLATPEANDEYLVFRDLHRGKAVGRKEDLGSFSSLLRWIDDRPDSVQALAQSLGLRFKPPYVVAFFDKKLESQLADLEKRELAKRHYTGPESNIEETIFRIESRPGGKYVPTIQSLKLKGN